jgi:hypothetical protein
MSGTATAATPMRTHDTVFTSPIVLDWLAECVDYTPTTRPNLE